MDFRKLKSMSGNKTLEKLTAELSKVNTTSTQNQGKDTRFWTPTVDKAGNGMAIIRFLPAPPNEDVPFVRLFDHGFQGPNGSWYIENSLTTLKLPDPVSEYNTKLWNSGVESDKEIVRKQKRRLHFISNIYVVQDKENPQNEGKVFLYKYGKKIFDKLSDAMAPEFEGDEAINPFDLWAGANFRLKMRMEDGYRSYGKSEFEKVSPLLEDDDALEAIWKQEHSLAEFIAPINFKSYEELKTRLERVLGLNESPVTRPGNLVRSSTAEDTPFEPDHKASVDDGDDTLDYFRKLASKS